MITGKDIGRMEEEIVKPSLNTQSEPLNYLLYTTDLATNGSGGYVYNNKAILNELIEHGVNYLFSHSIGSMFANSYSPSRFSLDTRQLLMRRILSENIPRTNIFSQLLFGLNFWEQETDSALFQEVLNHPKVKNALREYEITNLPMRKLNGMNESIKVMRENPVLIRNLFRSIPSYRTYPFNIGDFWKWFNEDHIKAIRNAVKANPHHFNKVYEGEVPVATYQQMESYNTSGYYTKFIPALANKSLNELKNNYIIFVRPQYVNSFDNDYRVAMDMVFDNSQHAAYVLDNVLFDCNYLYSTRDRNGKPINDTDRIGMGCGSMRICMVYKNNIHAENAVSNTTRDFKVWAEVYEIRNFD